MFRPIRPKPLIPTRIAIPNLRLFADDLLEGR
jgi:hypothetical protein